MNKKLIWLIIFIVCLGSVYTRITYLYHTPKTVGLKKDVIVMDRHTLSHSLVSIFGEKAKPVVLQSIFDLGAPVGGGCDYYSMNYDDKRKLVDPFTRCPSMQRDINTPVFMPMNALRTAAVDKACRRLTADDEMMTHALKMSQLDVTKAVTIENIEKLHFTFHKSPMEESQANVYKRWISQADPNPSWRLVVYSMCVSPSWQTL
jgi:hypothetical protein